MCVCVCVCVCVLKKAETFILVMYVVDDVRCNCSIHKLAQEMVNITTVKQQAQSFHFVAPDAAFDRLELPPSVL